MALTGTIGGSNWGVGNEGIAMQSPAPNIDSLRHMLRERAPVLESVIDRYVDNSEDPRRFAMRDSVMETIEKTKGLLNG